jgi:nitroreductase
MPDFVDVLKSRRSVRSYTQEPVDGQTLQELIDLAILAPTGMNGQPWRFTVVTERETLTGLNTRVREILDEQQIAEKMPSERIAAMMRAPDFSIFYHAPALVVISAERGDPSAPFDCQLAMGNLLLAAAAKGLGACYMGFLLFGREDEAVRRLLQMPDDRDLLAACCVGHPQVMPEGPPVRDPAEILWIK